MSQELKYYKTNLNLFMDTLSKSIVEYITCDVDIQPTFNKQQLPFDFIYCNSISFKTSTGNFTVQTSMTQSGFETFWVLPMTSDIKSVNLIKVDSKLKDFKIIDGYENLPYKLVLEFDESKIFLYAAEIYDTITAINDYKINDEMLLLFQSERDANKFEALTNYG